MTGFWLFGASGSGMEALFCSYMARAEKNAFCPSSRAVVPQAMQRNRRQIQAGTVAGTCSPSTGRILSRSAYWFVQGSPASDMRDAYMSWPEANRQVHVQALFSTHFS